MVLLQFYNTSNMDFDLWYLKIGIFSSGHNISICGGYQSYLSLFKRFWNYVKIGEEGWVSSLKLGKKTTFPFIHVIIFLQAIIFVHVPLSLYSDMA